MLLTDIPEGEYVVFEHGPFGYDQECRTVEEKVGAAMKAFDYGPTGCFLDTTPGRIMYLCFNPGHISNTSDPSAAWNASDYKSKRPAPLSRPFHFYSSSRNRAALSMAAAAFLMGNI